MKKGSARNRVDDLRNRHGLDVTWTSQKRKSDDQENEGPPKQPRTSKSPSKRSPAKKEAMPVERVHGIKVDRVDCDDMFRDIVDNISNVPVAM